MDELSKIQRLIINAFARNDAERDKYVAIAQEHKRRRDDNEACPWSDTRDFREALAGLLLRYAYDRPYMFVLAPIGAALLYVLIVAHLFGGGI